MLISTYNVRNLFLAGEGPAKPEKALRPLARMIDQVGADVMVLQEVGSQASLQRLNARLAQPYPVVESLPGNSNRSIHLGLLSRLQVSLSSHHDTVLTDAEGEPLHFFHDESQARLGQVSPLRFQRDLLLAEIEVLTGVSLALFCVHLKSRTNQSWQEQGADIMRAAECRAIRDIIGCYREQHPDARVLIIGDFNDRISSDALAPLQALGFADPLGDVLRKSGRNPSTYWPKRRMRIDHILVSPNTASLVVPGSPTIHVSNMARTASDHYPVSLALALDAPVAHDAQ